MSDRQRPVRSRLQLIWMLLVVFLAWAAVAAVVALFIEPAAEANPGTTGWLIFAAAVVVTTVALALLQQHWFFGTPRDLGGAVMTGVFIRLAIAESVFLIVFSLYFTGVMSRGTVVAALAVAVVLTWAFAAPTGRNTSLMQDQLERKSVPGDVDTALRQPMTR